MNGLLKGTKCSTYAPRVNQTAVIASEKVRAITANNKINAQIKLTLLSTLTPPSIPLITEEIAMHVTKPITDI